MRPWKLPLNRVVVGTFPSFIFYLMFCSWNVRGAGKKGFVKTIVDQKNVPF